MGHKLGLLFDISCSYSTYLVTFCHMWLSYCTLHCFVVVFLFPGHQQTFPSNCDRSLPERGQRSQQDGCYVNSVSCRALKHTSIHTRVVQRNRPFNNSGLRYLNRSTWKDIRTVMYLISEPIAGSSSASPGPGSTYLTHKKVLFYLYLNSSWQIVCWWHDAKKNLTAKHE